MAKERMVNTKFWDDSYITGLDPIEKLLYLYFLTNPLTNIAGIYEIQLRRVAFDTGIDKDMIIKVLDRFSKDKKIFFENGWIFIKNFIKNQKKNPKVEKGIELAIELVPKQIRDRLSIDYHSLSHPNPNPNPNPNSNAVVGIDLQETLKKQSMEYNYDDDVREIRKRKTKISKDKNNFLISVGMLWVKMAMNHFGIRQEEVPIKNIYYVIRSCWERENWNYKDFESLFKYFFESTLKEDDKISFDLCMSEKYVAKYKIAMKNKPVTSVSASNEIAL